MSALNKRIKTMLLMMCWMVLSLAIFQFSSIESYGQPLTIKVATTGNRVQLTSNNYNRCEWTSSAPDVVSLSPASGKTTTGAALSYSPNWIVITAKCTADGSAYQSQCIELTVQAVTLNIYQGFSGMSRGASGTCQYGSF